MAGVRLTYPGPQDNPVSCPGLGTLCWAVLPCHAGMRAHPPAPALPHPTPYMSRVRPAAHGFEPCCARSFAAQAAARRHVESARACSAEPSSASAQRHRSPPSGRGQGRERGESEAPARRTRSAATSAALHRSTTTAALGTSLACATMNAAYSSALRDVTALKTDLARLESREAPPPPDLDARFDALSTTLEDYERLAKRELVFTKQQKALTRLKEFRRQEDELRTRVAAAIQAAAAASPAASGAASTATALGPAASAPRALHARGLSALAPGGTPSPAASPAPLAGAAQSGAPAYGYGGGYSGYSPGSSYVGYGGYGSYNAGGGGGDPRAAYRMNASAAAMFAPGSGREAHALREHSFIEQTEAQLDAFISQGREVWESLTEQRHILKGTRRRLLDAANTLGLSRKVIGYVERRSIQDNVIFVLGAIFTLVSFCACSLASPRPPTYHTYSCGGTRARQITSTSGSASLRLGDVPRPRHRPAGVALYLLPCFLAVCPMQSLSITNLHLTPHSLTSLLQLAAPCSWLQPPMYLYRSHFRSSCVSDAH